MGIYVDTYGDHDCLRWPAAQEARQVDWSERGLSEYAEDGDGPSTYRYVEAVRLADVDDQVDGDVLAVVVDGTCACLPAPDEDARADYGEWLTPDDAESWANEADEDAEITRRDTIARALATLADSASEHAEGPLINYMYPVAHGDDEDLARDWAVRIAELPLCVVMLDGVTGLALTGGGMDLSWSIARAFVAIGYRPPMGPCASLPDDGSGWTEDDRRALLAVIDTLEAEAATLTGGAQRLRERYTVTDA